MKKHKVTWTVTHSVEVEAQNLAEAKKMVNEMPMSQLVSDPTYTIEIDGLPRDTSGK